MNDFNVVLTDSPHLMEAQVSLTHAADCLSQDVLCVRETEAAAHMCHVRQNTAFSLRGVKIKHKYKNQHG